MVSVTFPLSTVDPEASQICCVDELWVVS